MLYNEFGIRFIHFVDDIYVDNSQRSDPIIIGEPMPDTNNFADFLLSVIEAKRSFVAVGLDPDYAKIPIIFRKNFLKSTGTSFSNVADSIIVFNKCIIDAVAPIVPAVKPQMAYYERYGLEGLRAFIETVHYARNKGLIVIADVKRNDIGPTAKAYSSAYIGRTNLSGTLVESALSVDAITVNPYIGSDGISPFVQDAYEYGKGIFILVRTSNPSSIEFQDLAISGTNSTLCQFVASKVNEWGKMLIGKMGYSSVGAVVGATSPAHARVLRKIMPNAIFLVPGYGAQGGKGKDIVFCFNEDGHGAIISASRSINYPHGDDLRIRFNEYVNLVQRTVTMMNDDIIDNLMVNNRVPW